MPEKWSTTLITTRWALTSSESLGKEVLHYQEAYTGRTSGRESPATLIIKNLFALTNIPGRVEELHSRQRDMDVGFVNILHIILGQNCGICNPT